MSDKTPKPPTNPSEPEYSNEDHDYPEEPDTIIFDGPGREQQNRTDYTIITVLINKYQCRRDGCDAVKTERLLFAAEDVLENNISQEKIEKMAANAEFQDACTNPRQVDINSIETINPVTKEEVIVEARDIETSETGGLCTGKPQSH